MHTTNIAGGVTENQIGTARLYFADGSVDRYDDQRLAFAVWLGLPRGVRVAFRGKGDNCPVYPWDRVDRLP